MKKMCVTCSICGGTFSRMKYFDEHWLRSHAVEYGVGMMKRSLVLSFVEGQEDWAMKKISNYRKDNFISPYSGFDVLTEEEGIE